MFIRDVFEHVGLTVTPPHPGGVRVRPDMKVNISGMGWMNGHLVGGPILTLDQWLGTVSVRSIFDGMDSSAPSDWAVRERCNDCVCAACGRQVPAVFSCQGCQQAGHTGSCQTCNGTRWVDRPVG
jgi:hypothetical protein